MAADKVEASVPASSSSPMNPSGKLKLLAVHGYLQVRRAYIHHGDRQSHPCCCFVTALEGKRDPVL